MVTQLRQVETGPSEPGAALVAEMGKNPPAVRETCVRSLGWEDPLEEGMATHSGILSLENPQGQRSLVGCSQWGHRVGYN